MKEKFKIGVGLGLIILATGCGIQREFLISGRTMGTTYHITIVMHFWKNPAGLHQKIDRRLEEINRSMSTYRVDSEISRFNSLTSVTKQFKASDDFMQVALAAEKIYRLSGGAWDGTIEPLVERWGFKSTGAPKTLPSEKEIKRLLDSVGFDHLEVSRSGYLKKKKPGISLDFASIAKGYAVDQVAALLRAEGLENFLVEIGGEVYAAGIKINGSRWKVGINQPSKDAPPDRVYRAVPLENQALATSGDYRNFFELDGKTYSHIIDPRTGFPVDNGVVSVSIRAESCMLADGLATAGMVMGPEKGLALLEGLEGVEGLIVVRQKDGSLLDYYTKGFKVNS